jgi:hypothetical protein
MKIRTPITSRIKINEFCDTGDGNSVEPFAPTATPVAFVATGLPANTPVNAVPHLPIAFNAFIVQDAPPQPPDGACDFVGFGFDVDIDSGLVPHALHAFV